MLEGQCSTRCWRAILGVSRRRAFTVTTERDLRQHPEPDLVNRQFRALGPDPLWVADMELDVDATQLERATRRRRLPAQAALPT
jgi:hypothetical protein